MLGSPTIRLKFEAPDHGHTIASTYGHTVPWELNAGDLATDRGHSSAVSMLGRRGRVLDRRPMETNGNIYLLGF